MKVSRGQFGLKCRRLSGQTREHRFRRESGKAWYVHTLNASGLIPLRFCRLFLNRPTGRRLCRIPEVLRKWMVGRRKFAARLRIRFLCKYSGRSSVNLKSQARGGLSWEERTTDRLRRRSDRNQILDIIMYRSIQPPSLNNQIDCLSL